MSWLDKLLNRESNIDTRLEVGDAALVRKENKQCELDKFEIESVTGRKVSTNDMYARPWRYAITMPPKLNRSAASLGIDESKLSADEKKALETAGFTFG